MQQDKLIQLLTDLRLEARAQKNFALAGQVRDRLAGIGVQLRDTPEGTKW